MKFARAKIVESHQKLKLIVDGRGYRAEVFGTGNNCTVEIDEMNFETGLVDGRKKSYRVPGRVKWSVVVARYRDDVTPRVNA